MTNLYKGKVQIRAVTKLIPYENNVKIHDKDQVAKIAKSIEKAGWSEAQAIEVDKNGVIINGHGRRLAAIKLGMKNVPVLVRDDLSEEDVKAYRLLDNKVAEGKIDTRLFAQEIASFDDAKFMFEGIYEDREIDFAVEDNGEMDFGAMTDSLLDDMDDHQGETMDRIGEEDEKEIPISRVFSFSRVSGSQARKLKLLEKYAEGKTELKGSKALSSLSDKLLGQPA